MKPLAAEQLVRRCDPSRFDFRTTRDLEGLEDVLGQERAVESIEFGIGIRRPGYNVVAVGPTGVGKHSVVRRLLERKAQKESPGEDVCYVNDFRDSRRPKRLLLPAGRAVRFRDAVARSIDEMREAVREALESEDYHKRRSRVEEDLKQRQRDAIADVQKRAEQQGIRVLETPGGLALAPIRDDGGVMPSEEVQKLPGEEQERLQERVTRLREELDESLRHMPRWQHESRERLRELHREVVRSAVEPIVDELRRHWDDVPETLVWLDRLVEDVVENPQPLTHREGQAQGQQQQLMAMLQGQGQGQGQGLEMEPERRYQVNVLVDRSAEAGAPVVYEDHPTLAHLVGRIEHVPRFGTLTTDFTQIRSGALHRANGGYLILDVRNVLLQPFSWEFLKRALRSREIRIQAPGLTMNPMTALTLEPEPVPLEVKVVLVGEPFLYEQLSQLDPDFDQLFKVVADFEERIDRNEDGEMQLARLVARVARQEDLRPFDREAVAAVVEQGARLAAHARRVSIRMQAVTDLLREADHHAGRNGHDEIRRDDVEQAIRAERRRHGRVRDRLREEIREGTLRIATEGKATGQVNALSVLRLGRAQFGRPSRVSARVRLGSGNITDIEREVELGGPIHSKGVMILGGFLGERYALDQPLAVAATLVFEQSYVPIEGDSASLAELVALLSALADVPVRQSLAVTGSVDQHGAVQAVGGVNEKVEGFFDVCCDRGLTGEPGVVLPASNTNHLMLEPSVVDAAREGRFGVYPVETIDQAVELLLDRPAGERDEQGRFPEGSLNRLVQDRIDEFAKRMKRFAARESD